MKTRPCATYSTPNPHLNPPPPDLPHIHTHTPPVPAADRGEGSRRDAFGRGGGLLDGIATPAESPGGQPGSPVSVGICEEGASRPGNGVNNSNEAECELLL